MKAKRFLLYQFIHTGHKGKRKGMNVQILNYVINNVKKSTFKARFDLD